MIADGLVHVARGLEVLALVFTIILGPLVWVRLALERLQQRVDVGVALVRVEAEPLAKDPAEPVGPSEGYNKNDPACVHGPGPRMSLEIILATRDRDVSPAAMVTAMDLEQLLRAVRDRQPGALEELVAELEDVLYAYFCSRRLSHHVAQDLTHDTLMVVIDKLPGLPEQPGRPSLRAWLFTTARYKSLEQWREEANRVETTLRRAEAIAAPGGSLSSQARLAEQKIELERGLAAMPPYLRDMVEFDLDDGDRKAFASAKGIEEVTMRSQRRRYRGWLRQHFSDFSDDS